MNKRNLARVSMFDVMVLFLGRYTAVTDAHGKCILKDLEPGTRKVTIYHKDYTQKTLEVKLKPGKSNKVKAAL